MTIEVTIDDPSQKSMMTMNKAQTEPQIITNQVVGARLVREKLRNIIFQELKDGVIRVAKSGEVGFLSSIHVALKKEGKWRKILDCRELNKQLRIEPFKMDGVQQIKQLITQRDFATSLDLHQAFHHIRVSTEFQPYLGFRFEKIDYIYQGIPFGVATAPRKFTKTLKPAMMELRRRWESRILAYADDILLPNQDQQILRQETVEIKNFLMSLGWLIAEDKSQMESSQEFEFLGWLWRKEEMTFQLTVDRRRSMLKKLRLMMNKVKNREKIPVRKLTSLIGGIRFIEAQWKRGPLLTKQLDHLKSKTANQSGWKSLVQLTPQLMKDLSWWFNKMGNNLNGCLQGRMRSNAKDSIIREENSMGTLENSYAHIIQLERVTSYSSHNEMIFEDFVKRTCGRHYSADRQHSSYVQLEQRQSSSPSSRFSEQHSTFGGTTEMESRSVTHTRDNEQGARQLVLNRSIRRLCDQQRHSSYSTDETENRNNDGRIRHTYQQIAEKVLQCNQGHTGNGKRRLINQLGEDTSQP
ncbi:MAG: putative Transposon Ty3-G Gag-Pol polyprotein [Streblomastix strix]|uniref:Putative Transposon Ty3-G Gag-Pol polyprotein n=1 Tax=Streblomastix strix TaxID=222440 RepID=A0A5J4X0X2_9EUKA|nr:MAG: putative Transposon Ty3-G Gag-Pol polyprotein [Streblomastix strix]